MVTEAAIKHCSSQSVAVRSKAAHLAICGLGIRKGLLGDNLDAAIHRDLADRVAHAVAAAARLGVHDQAAEFVADFLQRHQQDGFSH